MLLWRLPVINASLLEKRRCTGLIHPGSIGSMHGKWPIHSERGITLHRSAHTFRDLGAFVDSIATGDIPRVSISHVRPMHEGNCSSPSGEVGWHGASSSDLWRPAQWGTFVFCVVSFWIYTYKNHSTLNKPSKQKHSSKALARVISVWGLVLCVVFFKTPEDKISQWVATVNSPA